MGVALRPSQEAEVELHIQMGGEDIENDLLDLVDPVRDADDVREDDPDITDLILLFNQGVDAAPGDGGIDRTEGKAVPAERRRAAMAPRRSSVV